MNKAKQMQEEERQKRVRIVQMMHQEKMKKIAAEQ